MATETIFTMDTSSIKFGAGATREIGFDMRNAGAKRVLVVTDAHLASLHPVVATLDSLREAGVDAVLYDGTRVEPTDSSFKEAIAFAADGDFDGYVAVGGGSSIDTAKAANLYSYLPRRPPRICKPAYRGGPARARQAQAVDRHPNHRRHGQRDNRRVHL